MRVEAAFGTAAKGIGDDGPGVIAEKKYWSDIIAADEAKLQSAPSSYPALPGIIAKEKQVLALCTFDHLLDATVFGQTLILNSDGKEPTVKRYPDTHGTIGVDSNTHTDMVNAATAVGVPETNQLTV